MTLHYVPFAACRGIVDASRNAPPLKQGTRGVAVQVLQGGLIQLGFALPASTKAGHPDGIFGAETHGAVCTYQMRKHLPADGIAGSNTIVTMDSQLASMSKPPAMAPPAPPVITSRDYQLGTSDPPLRQDLGAGFWNSKPKEAGYVALGGAIVDVLPIAYVVIGDDATKHLAHYFRNTGTTYEIDLEGMIAEVASAKSWYEREVDQAKRFVEKLDPGRYSITSQNAEWAYNRPTESRNWYFAVGGYLYWGKGVAEVKSSGSGITCELDFEYKFYDRYNWDAGQSVSIAGITVTDHYMGEFHRQGLAREFDCVGSVRRKFSWKKGEGIAADQLHPVGGRG